MRRKYDLRNKKSFLIILLVAILVICIFFLFIYKYTKISKIFYTIEAGSVIQDTAKNYIKIDDDGILRPRWNGDYYLTYQDQKIDLDNKVIVYNEITGGMKLYGVFYEILEDGKIVKYQDETVLANTTDTKFYKLADREYLLVDREIVSSDKFTNTVNYLLVELDKLGNAKLSNNKINLKTITPMILVTSKYRFDINNEILNFGSYDIDLKKIIGSTNQYKPEEVDKDVESDGTTGENGGNAGNGTGTGGAGGETGDGTGFGGGTGTGTGNGTGIGNGNGVINNSPDGEETDIGEIKDKTKMTSVVRVSEGLTQIDVDYVVYDPYNEYKSVYAEVMKAGKLEVVYLSKTDTHIVFDNLVPDTEYSINFVYTTTDGETGEIVRNTFEKLELRTKKPEYSIEIYKISSVSNTITYKVYMQSGYSIDNVLVNVSFEYIDIDSETGESVKKQASIDNTIAVSGSNKYVMGTTSVSGYNIDKDTVIKLTVKSVSSGDKTIDINSSSSFRYGR